MRTIKSPLLILPGLGAVLLLAAGCATVTGDYRIPDGASKIRSYTSVTGDITVGRQAKIHDATTVAGDIDIGEGSRVGSLATVAGKIRLAADVKVEGSVKTVAGDIEIARGGTITGNVDTVAGHITLEHSAVTGNMTVTSGRVDLSASRISGTLLVKGTDDGDGHPALINIGPDSEVTEVVVEPKARARLEIHRSAKVGAVKGIKADYYR